MLHQQSFAHILQRIVYFLKTQYHASLQEPVLNVISVAISSQFIPYFRLLEITIMKLGWPPMI
jgi:hypothetical protein